MNFTMTYEGRLKTRKTIGALEHKLDIRRVFHRQLQELWNHTPFPELVCPPYTLTTNVGTFRFFPIVSNLRREIAELNMLMLRRESGPGFIVKQGGDIDNRLKTLLDALRMPKNINELPENAQPQEGECPFFCLLADDSLITKLSVSTDRLLEPVRTGLLEASLRKVSQQESYVKLVINVQVRQLPVIGANMLIRSGRH
jgi:hypothetical protein